LAWNTRSLRPRACARSRRAPAASSASGSATRCAPRVESWRDGGAGNRGRLACGSRCCNAACRSARTDRALWHREERLFRDHSHGQEAAEPHAKAHPDAVADRDARHRQLCQVRHEAVLGLENARDGMICWRAPGVIVRGVQSCLSYCFDVATCRSTPHPSDCRVMMEVALACQN
jgi:hypothetical protein